MFPIRTLRFPVLPALLAATLLLAAPPAAWGQNAWINEIHYDNAGSDDSEEYVEVVIENAGNFTLSDFSVVAYDGNGGGVDGSPVSGQNFNAMSTEGRFTIYAYRIGLQNGPDGAALCYQSTPVTSGGQQQFLSYEGTFTATDGCASGETSTDIGVEEFGGVENQSLQLGDANGASYADFSWQGETSRTFGAVNQNQTFQNFVAVEASGDAGWRMLAPPVTNLTVGHLADSNLVQGVPNMKHSSADPNLFTGYTASDGYRVPSGAGESLEAGRGFYWYLFAQAKASETNALPDTLYADTSGAVAGEEQTLFDESFDEADGTTSGTDDSGNNVTWNRDITGTDVSSGGTFSVQSGVFEATDISDGADGKATWLTDSFSIPSGVSSVDLSLDASGNDGLDENEPFLIQYSTDGGSTYTTAADRTGETFDATITENDIAVSSGDHFIVRVQIRNNTGGETQTFDDVTVTGRLPSVTVDVSDTSQDFFLLGNPFPQNYDLSGLNLSAQNFNTTVQVWDPDASSGNGSYQPVTQVSGVADGDDSDNLALWQGFFAERAGGSKQQLTFDAGGRTDADATFYGGTNLSNSGSGGASSALAAASRSAASPERRILPLRLTGRSADGDVTSYDEAARLYFHPQARRPGAGGPDVWDATKLAPFTEGAFATIALAPGDAMKAQEGLPFAPDEKIEVPVRFDRSGAAAGETFTVTWPRSAWEHIPGGWALEWTDRQTGQTVSLRDTASYEFAPAASGGERTAAAVRAATPGRALPLAKAMAAKAEAGGAPEAQAAADAPRFLLTVDPNAGLPVEATQPQARADGRDAVVTWRTFSETGNARFVVEREGEDGTWMSAAAVPTKASGGTSTEPIAYRARVEALAYGTHTFRLRQIDEDGAAAPVGTPMRVEVHMEEAFALSGVYPNPFRDRATIEVAAREAQQVTVALFDARGRRVRTLFRGRLPAGETRALPVEAGGLASGVYVVRLRGETGPARTQTVTLVR